LIEPDEEDIVEEAQVEETSDELVLDLDSTIEIEDLTWYEIFPTTYESVVQTWQHIWNKEKQGLLKRAYKVDFEKYYPNGKVDIYISICPHC